MTRGNQFETLNLTQLVMEPTRVTESSSTLIDNIVVENAEMKKVGVVDTGYKHLWQEINRS